MNSTFSPQTVSQFVVVEFYDALSKQDDLRLWRLLDLQFEDETIPKGITGLNAIIHSIKEIHQAFEGLKITVESIEEKNNKVLARVTYKGQFTDEYDNIRPTNTWVKWSVSEEFQVNSGKRFIHRKRISSSLPMSIKQ